MIRVGTINCPICGGNLKYYDTTKRVLIGKYGVKRYIYIRRFKCQNCNRYHRELPDHVHPYLRYEPDIIQGVVSGFIFCTTFGYEDYPCEMTMRRWRSRDLQLL